MKKNFNFYKHLLLPILAIAASCNAPSVDHSKHSNYSTTDSLKIQYTCPMHPEIKSDTDGICPKCLMDLEPIQPKKNIDTISFLIQPTDQLVISGLQAISPSSNKGNKRIEAIGYLTYNPNNVKSISAKVSGRIEKLYVKSNFQTILKGQKLMEIYSPELQTAQQEFLDELVNAQGNDFPLKSILQNKLRNLGMTANEIEKLMTTKSINPTISIYSEYSGHLHFLSNNSDISQHGLSWPSTELKNTPSSTMSNSESMENNAMESSTTENKIQEGNYITKGQLIFTIVDQSSIWALFKILPSDIPNIDVGNEVEIFVNENIHYGKINFIEKSFNRESDFYTARVELNCNDHSGIAIGSLVRGYISSNQAGSNSYWVPSLAVLDLGRSKSAVFIKEPIGYSAKEIKTGKRIEGWVQVISGLTEADSIAPVASYLVDSEAFINTK